MRLYSHTCVFYKCETSGLQMYFMLIKSVSLVNLVGTCLYGEYLSVKVGY